VGYMEFAAERIGKGVHRRNRRCKGDRPADCPPACGNGPRSSPGISGADVVVEQFQARKAESVRSSVDRGIGLDGVDQASRPVRAVTMEARPSIAGEQATPGRGRD
jgi:hypothetical protein